VERKKIMSRITQRSRRSALAFLTILVLGINCTVAVDAQKKSRAKKPVYYSVPVNSVLHVRLDQELDSEQNRVGDMFTATLVDPVYSSGGVLLIPQGSTVNGRVTNVSRAGKGGEPASMDVQFISVELPNGVRQAINGSLTDLESSGGKSDNEGTVSAKKTSHRNVKFIGGGAAGGAVIGAIAGGGKGLAIGSLIGAGAGLIGSKVKKGHEVKVKKDTEFGIILNRSASFRKYRPAE
jgi:hypothetical protein